MAATAAASGRPDELMYASSHKGVTEIISPQRGSMTAATTVISESRRFRSEQRPTGFADMVPR